MSSRSGHLPGVELFRTWRTSIESQWRGRPRKRFASVLSIEASTRRFPDERERYECFLWLYLHRMPRPLRRYWAYFLMDQRAFGGDGFTAMWSVIFQGLRPQSALEIRVYRGQVLTLWGLLADLIGHGCEARGVSPLDASGDGVSDYRTSIDSEWDISQHFRYCDLGTPSLINADSQELGARTFISSRRWEPIYVDESHDLGDVIADLNLGTEALREEGILVVDDASLYSDSRPPTFSLRDHPGPSNAIRTAPGMSQMIENGLCGHNRIFRKTA